MGEQAYVASQPDIDQSKSGDCEAPDHWTYDPIYPACLLAAVFNKLTKQSLVVSGSVPWVRDSKYVTR
jgi:hypothetical protein